METSRTAGISAPIEFLPCGGKILPPQGNFFTRNNNKSVSSGPGEPVILITGNLIVIE